MSDFCATCQRADLEVQEARGYLVRVTRAALKNPTWPSNLERVRVAKAKMLDHREALAYHVRTEHERIR